MKIIEKNILAQRDRSRVVRMRVEAADIAARCLPGQFVVLMASERGERIPLTIVEHDKTSIVIIFQEVGASTRILGDMAVGESLFSLAGPLGRPTPIEKYGKVIVAGGGVGIAEAYPVIKAFKEAGNIVIAFLGARDKNHLILRKEIEALADRVYISTDNGSAGKKGLVGDLLYALLREDSNYQLVYCVGPLPMMKAVAAITKPYNIKTLVCLNAIMLDGTGMCGSCRLTVNKEIRFCCVDGPDFDAQQVDFDELFSRHKRFSGQEKIAADIIPRSCKCANDK